MNTIARRLRLSDCFISRNGFQPAGEYQRCSIFDKYFLYFAIATPFSGRRHYSPMPRLTVRLTQQYAAFIIFSE